MSQAAYEDGSVVPHEKLQLAAIATEPGYIYIYLSNENGKITDVYFDDLLINLIFTHPPDCSMDMLID